MSAISVAYAQQTVVQLLHTAAVLHPTNNQNTGQTPQSLLKLTWSNLSHLAHNFL